MVVGCGAPPATPGVDSGSAGSVFSPSITINSSATHTNSLSASLSLSAIGAEEMYLTSDISCTTGGTWEVFATTKSITLTSQNAVNVVAMKVKSLANGESECVSASITHDDVAPIISFSVPVSGTYINVSNASAFTVGGTCTENANVAISGDASSTAACASGVWAQAINLSTLPDGNVNLTATPTDLASNLGSAVNNSFVKDTVVPTLSLTAPVSGTIFNAANISNVTFSGTCSEDTRDVVVSGAFSDTIVCSSGSWSKSYDLSATPEGAFSLNFNHSDIAGNNAVQVVANYTKDTVAPTLTIVNPANLVYVNSSNYTSYTINGTCSENGQNVVLSGAFDQTVTCSAGTWSLIKDFTAIADGALSLSASHVDAAGNSVNASVNFSKDILPPQSPTVNIAAGAATTNSLSVVLDLSAVDASEMYITNVAACASGGVYEAYATSKNWNLMTADAVNTVYVKYRDLAGNESACISDDIIHMTAAPTLTFDNPVNGTWVNIANQNVFTVSGTCSENGQNVVISGTASATVVCTALAWSANLNLAGAAEGTDAVTVTVNHSNAASVPATPITRTFSKDTVSPAAPVVTNPVSSPYTSSTSPLAVSGTCESGATVVIAGAESLNASCVADAFSANLTQAVDGSYNYTFAQSDAAGNPSSASSFQWVKDSTIPPVPIIASPNPNPSYTNTNTVTISGSCVSGNTVKLAGDVVAGDVTSPAGQLTTSCTSNAFTFIVQKTVDGTYSFSVLQTSGTGVDSPSAAAVWTRDTVAPLAPVILSPPTSPYTASGNLTLSGTCEDFSTVNLSGDDIQTVACSSGTFSFDIIKSVDATYNFSLTQTDRATNVSVAASQQWVRDSAVLPVPVITDPATSPYSSNDSALPIQGTCVAGYTVTVASGAIAGEMVQPANSLTTTCVGGNFSFLISKTVDGTYDFTFTQTDGNLVSPAVPLQWNRDTTAPISTIATKPTDPNYKVIAGFTFTADDASATFECNLNSTGWTTCVSPYNLTNLTNGSQTLQVRALDVVGNIEAVPTSYTWVQNAYKTIALYKFDAGNEMIDSGLYAGALNNLLTNMGSSTWIAGVYNEGRAFSSASSQHAVAADSVTLNILNETMTLDFRVNFDSLPGNGEYITIISKMGAAGQMGWDLSLRKQGGNYQMAFRGSLDGNTVTELRSTNMAISTGTWYHFTVTWDKGNLKYYMNGTAFGARTLGTVGSAKLFNSNASLRLGRTETMGGSYLYFNGKLDEVRLSQILRWVAAFTPPATAYTPD